MRIALGWSPDIVDLRDNYGGEEASILMGRPSSGAFSDVLPTAVDLCDDVDDLVGYDLQDVDATVAQSILTLIDWQSRRTRGESLRRSCLFLHQMTQRLYGGGGVHGIGFRATFKALRRFGSPPESLWPSKSCRVSVSPESPELYGFSMDFRCLRYVRVDVSDRTIFDSTSNLQRVKRVLARGMPCVCGFGVPDFIERVVCVPFRSALTRILGGAAIIIVGYDDSIRVGGTSGSQKGALRFRSCWGESWGDRGFGWLPYEYVNQRMASDFWSVIIQS